MYRKIVKKEWKKENPNIFHDQKIVGKEILRKFTSKTLITLCAPPQWGKTGVSLYVSYKLSLQKIQHVFYLTGMSDKTWVDQTKERVLSIWKDNIYHRNTLHRFKNRLFDLKGKQNDKNILIIIDECHIANKTDNMLSEIVEELGIKDIDELKEKNIKILQISATPSNALIDAEKWKENHCKVVPVLSPHYVSFHTFMDDERMKSPYELSDFRQAELFIDHFDRFPNQRYHFVRISSKGPSGKFIYHKTKTNLSIVCDKKSYDIIELNGSLDKMKVDQIYSLLSTEPPNHVIIIIKDMLGAAKTIDDTYIGCVHESTPNQKDYSSEVQGLPGRLCGWTKQKGSYSPIIFCNQEIIETYLDLYDSDFDFEELSLWKDNKVKTNRKGEIISKSSYLSLY